MKFNNVLNVAEQNAEVISETYNSIADLLKAVREKAKAAIEKINANTKCKPTANELKELEKLAQNAIDAKTKELELLKTQGNNPEYNASLTSWLPTTKPKRRQ